MRKAKIGLWWWYIFWAVINATIVLFNFITDTVMWLTWLNGAAAIYLASRAGSYPVSESTSKRSEE